nr:hypothetical protein Iba_chr03aCG8060 [Ipomoea batatas]
MLSPTTDGAQPLRPPPSSYATTNLLDVAVVRTPPQLPSTQRHGGTDEEEEEVSKTPKPPFTRHRTAIIDSNSKLSSKYQSRTPQQSPTNHHRELTASVLAKAGERERPSPFPTAPKSTASLLTAAVHRHHHLRRRSRFDEDESSSSVGSILRRRKNDGELRRKVAPIFKHRLLSLLQPIVGAIFSPSAKSRTRMDKWGR